MFPTSSKLFFGASFVAAVVAVVHGLVSGDVAGIIVLSGVAIIAAFLGGVGAWSRDGQAAIPSGGVSAVPSAAAVSSSIWPMVGGIAAAITAVGLVVDQRIFGFGLVMLGATGAEWMLQSWSDRASADPAFNAQLRGRLGHPFEFPVLGAVIAGSIIFAFSRVMVALKEMEATIVFSVVGLVILLAAVLVAMRPRMSGRGISALAGLGAVVLAAGAIAAINVGEAEHEHKEHTELIGNKSVANKANTIATVKYHEGKITFLHDDAEFEDLEVPRATASNLLLRNDSDETVLFVFESVKVETDAEGNTKLVPAHVESDPVGPGKAKVLTVNIPKAGTYKLKIEPIEGGDAHEREVVVQ